MGANALRLLESWGITIEELKATPFIQERHLKEDTGEMVHFVDHSWTQEATGYPWLAMRRVHLYAALVRAARRTPEGKVPIKMHTSNAATKVDCEAGKLCTEKGDEVEADVVVVADGVFVSSPARRPIHPFS
jgi:2-polyprenyl-6-methoxyphenol hydroxylase-like FAD-dependent oxidoreductase